MLYHLGTSGWSYPQWRLKFYPPGTASGDWLEFYSRQFSTVEVNMTFYRFPKPEILRSWMERTPPQFAFTLKANREITHTKKLRKVANEVRYFNILADSLKGKLGCLLYQLPPSIKLDLELLADFLKTLSSDYRNVIEFRDESWYDPAAQDLLRQAGVAFCAVSSTKVPRTVFETAPFAYFRFHGLTGEHRYRYSDEELSDWAEAIRSLPSSRECFVYFNNDYQAHAVENCRRLADLLGARYLVPPDGDRT
jgi:uncharacterized protein YecE (DUF72 family)